MPEFVRIGYHMQIVSVSAIFVMILEGMFVAGMAGSAIVLILTGIEDIETLLEKEEEVTH